MSIILRLYQADGPEAHERVLPLLEEFDLLPCLHGRPALLSRGQRYKAALVALLAVDPEVWLFDEPFASGLDPLGLAAFRRHARAATLRGRTIISSTQILEAAERLSDRAIILHEGRLRAFDPVSELLKSSNEQSSLAELFEHLRDEPV